MAGAGVGAFLNGAAATTSGFLTSGFFHDGVLLLLLLASFFLASCFSFHDGVLLLLGAGFFQLVLLVVAAGLLGSGAGVGAAAMALRRRLAWNGFIPMPMRSASLASPRSPRVSMPSFFKFSWY